MSVSTPHLSQEAYGDGLDAKIAASVPGMAHFALTGPSDTTCRQCAFWGKSTKFRRDGQHYLYRRTCQKFLRLCQAEHGPAIGPQTPSCRHFQAREVAPALIKTPERKPKAEKARKAKP